MRAALVLICCAVTASSADDGLEFFETRIRPVLAKQCYGCHAASLPTPFGGLRLDTRDAVRKGGKSGPAVVPRDPENSLLLQALEYSGKLKMPPTGKLSDRVIADFRQWIEMGAPDPREQAASAALKPGHWWSLAPIERPERPRAGEELRPWIRTTVDAFIAAKLREKGLAPSPEADRRTLLRRVYFDLIGVPPTPADLERFVADQAPDAYEKVVDRLLASPQYGERWAQHWMDIAHFAETDGYESDMVREHSWPYRDYLIRSFNRDKPYGRFIEEQIAGDMLFPSDPDGVIATGFLAAGPWDSNTIPPFSPDRPDVLRAYALDRDDMIQTVMAGLNSLTVHCARCHDHKFDPIPQKDYYALQAVFAGIDRTNRPYDEDPAVHEKRQRLLRAKTALDRRDPDISAQLLGAERQKEAAAWAESVQARLAAWRIVEPKATTSKNGVAFRPLGDGSVLASGPEPESDVLTLTLEPEAQTLKALRLEFLPHESLPLAGPGRSSQGSFLINEISVNVTRQGHANPVPVCLSRPLADYEFPGSEARNLTDSKRATGWRNYPRHGEYRQVVLPVEGGLALNRGDTLLVEIEQGGVQMIGRLRVSLTSVDLPESVELAPDAVVAAAALPSSAWTVEQKSEVAAYVWMKQIRAELAKLPEPKMVYAVTNDFAPRYWFAPVRVPRPIHLLERGDVERPRDLIGPGALSAIQKMPARFDIGNPNDEGQRRVALAKWLSDSNNPLTWRSIVNRVWHYHFGRGLVHTLNDFGHMGAKPTHPELLNWLAAEFRDSGGSLKRLHRLLVTSAVYRQSSKPNPAFVKLDADNESLWRMNRSRLDAESIRDAVLAVSGRLDAKMGGPSVKQAVVEKGVASAPSPNYAKFDWDSPEAGRRTVYRYIFRTLSDPFMDSLDFPNVSQMTPSRTGSINPLQSLVLLNNPFMISHSRRLAKRLSDMADSPLKQIEALYRLLLLREPSAEELREGEAYANRYGLANLCRVVLNSSEFIFVN